MAKSSVDIVVKAHDRASRNMRRMGKSTGFLTGQLTLLRIAVARVGIIAFQKFIGAIRGSISAASDAQESYSKFQQVFGEQAKAAEDFADRLAKSVGRSRYAIIDSLSVFQSFFKGLEFTSDKSRELSETMQRLAIDFASFHNLQDPEAVQRFISALSGSGEVLDRFGVNIKQAALQQELLRMGINKSWQQVTEQEKALGRLNVIMRAMGQQGAVGDAVRTLGSYANQLKALKAGVHDFAVTAGQIFIPIATEIVSVLRGAGPVMEWLAKTIKGAITGGIVLYTAFETVIKNWGNTFKLAGKVAVLGLVKFGMSVKHWLTTVIPDLLGWFGRNWRQIFTDIWNATKAIFTNMWKNIVMFFKNVWKWLKGEETDWIWTGLVEGFEATLEELPRILKRQRTPLERAMAKEIAELGGALNREFERKLAERLRWLEVGAGAGAAPGAPKMPGGAAGAAVAKAAAQRRGRLAPYEARFLTRMPGEQPEIKIMREIKKNSDEQKQLARQAVNELEELNRKKPVELAPAGLAG